MPFFEVNKRTLSLVKPINFKTEKEIQSLIEKNLETVFNCRFIASEFATGTEHAGRIDTLALSEDNNPVIIEYKKTESSDLINQSLFYLSWIKDHKGDFQVAANNSLGKNITVEWDDIRVICIAPGYKKYDLHAVQVMGANIELWQYRLLENSTFYLEEIFRKSTSLAGVTPEGKKLAMVEAGKKAALTRATGTYTFEQHSKKAGTAAKTLLMDLRDFILELDETVEETPKKFYVAYKIAQNFVCIDVRKDKLRLFLKLNPSEFKEMPKNARDVRKIGHYGTGDFEFTVRKSADIDRAKNLIRQAFERVGG